MALRRLPRAVSAKVRFPVSSFFRRRAEDELLLIPSRSNRPDDFLVLATLEALGTWPRLNVAQMPHPTQTHRDVEPPAPC